MSKVGIIEFDKLEVGQDLMKNNTYLREWRCPLPSLANGRSMFYSCSNLTTFPSQLPSLIDGYQMFRSCSNLTTFSSKLGSLKSGYQMFRSCNLNETSLRNIADNINDLKEKGYDKNIDEHWTYEVLGETQTISSSYRGRIDIGHDESVTQDVLWSCGNKLIAKGWDVYYNAILYEYIPPCDVSEANGWCPDAYKNGSDSWNTVVLTPYIDVLKISSVNENGEMSNNKGKVGIIEYNKLAVGDSLMKSNTYLQKWACPLSSLTDGSEMFRGCSKLTSFSSDLSNLKYGEYMFTGAGFATFSSNLSKLTDGEGMFAGCPNLTSFSSNLSKLTNGSRMFEQSKTLNSFTPNLPSLEDGLYMFDHCTSLTSFSSDLSNLKDAFSMFGSCTNLESFTSDLSSLISGYVMFSLCENLTTFNSNLKSLKSGYNMFGYCKLNEDSLRNIANTINDLKEKGYDKNIDEHWTYEVLGETETLQKAIRGIISIDTDVSVSQNVINECGKKMVEKGWEVYFNDRYFQ